MSNQNYILAITTAHSFSQSLFTDLYRLLRTQFSNIDRNDVRDAIGDAVEKAILNGKCELRHENLCRWLYRSAYNRCLDTYRKNRKRAHSLEDGNEHGFSTRPNQLEAELQHDLSLFSLSLSSTDKVILTCLLGGESVQEIGEKYGIPVKTVYKHKRSILVALRKWLHIPTHRAQNPNNL